MRATDTTVLREANTAVRIKMTSFNLIYRGLYQSAKFLSLCLGNGGLQILDLRIMFAAGEGRLLPELLPVACL
jgi:hypothetical protein